MFVGLSVPVTVVPKPVDSGPYLFEFFDTHSDVRDGEFPYLPEHSLLSVCERVADGPIIRILTDTEMSKLMSFTVVFRYAGR